MLNPRPEDVDFSICEYFGQMLVTVGEFAFQTSSISLLRMLHSRCFATIVQRHVSRSSLLLPAAGGEPRPDFKTPSLASVRAANSDFPLVTSKSWYEPTVRARFYSRRFHFTTGVYLSTPDV